MERVHLLNLGCPKNQVDGELMLGALARAGFEVSLDPEQAEVLVVNTCAFIEAAKKESLDAILRAANLKERAHGRRLVVSGCLAQRYGAELKAAMPEVDLLVGTGNFLDLPELLRRSASTPQFRAAPYPGAAHVLASADAPRLLTGLPWSAYVKVSEGCDHRCAFCIIPKIRGRHQSRPLDDIVAEVRTLAHGGVREINLVAQDLTAYGRDLRPRTSLAALLRALATIQDLRWIRLLYCYPNSVSDELLHTIAELPQVVKYMDMPLQHADDGILRAMRRERSVSALGSLLDRIRRQLPGLTLRTSFIVGFPGEDDRAFSRLLDFVRQQQFDRVGVFTYSREEGTAAYGFEGQVPQRVKAQRRRELMAVQAEVSLRKHQALLGKEIEVLVESEHPDGRARTRGRSASQAPEIDGSVFMNGMARAGQFVRALVERAFTYDLHARIVQTIA
jgi:ribosomal protein S12 methylthiotransferase